MIFLIFYWAFKGRFNQRDCNSNDASEIGNSGPP